MYRRIRPVFQWAVIFVVKLRRLNSLCFDTVNQLKNSSQLLIIIKYFNMCRIFILNIFKKNYVLRNTGPPDCNISSKINGIHWNLYAELWLNSAYRVRVLKIYSQWLPPRYYKIQVLCTAKYGSELCFMRILDIICTV